MQLDEDHSVDGPQLLVQERKPILINWIAAQNTRALHIKATRSDFMTRLVVFLDKILVSHLPVKSSINIDDNTRLKLMLNPA